MLLERGGRSRVVGRMILIVVAFCALRQTGVDCRFFLRLDRLFVVRHFLGLAHAAHCLTDARRNDHIKI